MNREDIQKLLGGYATGTLTPEEQQALFNAALEDQELFDQLARDQALRDVLEDPAARAHLLATLDERPEPWYRRWWRPAALALATAGVAVLALVVIRQDARPLPQQAVSTMAEAKPPAPAPPVPDAPPAAKQAAGEARPAPVPAPSTTAIRGKRQFETPAPVVKEKEGEPAARQLPQAPAVRDARPPAVLSGAPGAVVGGVTGGSLPAAPMAVPSPKAEVPAAKDQVVAADFADANNQRARMLFFGAPVSAFLGRQNETAVSAEARPATDTGEQKQRKAAEQARTMMRSATGALAARAVLPGAPPLGIRFTLLRKTADGTFAEVAPGGLQAGDTVEVRFEANQDGFLSVLGSGARPFAATNVSRRVPYTTVPIASGTDVLTVRFSRTPLSGGAIPSNSLQTPGDAGDRATYMALSNPLAEPLVFTISLPGR